MKTETLLLVGAAAVIAYLVLRQSSGGTGLLPSAINPRAADEQRLKSIIGVLPPDPRFLPKQDRVTLAKGTLTGFSQAAAVAPLTGPAAPFVLAGGTAAGAIASLFID